MDLLSWGIAHLPEMTGDEVLQEAVETVLQVSRKKTIYIMLGENISYSSTYCFLSTITLTLFLLTWVLLGHGSVRAKVSLSPRMVKLEDSFLK